MAAHRHKRRGGPAVELALTLPVFILFLGGVLDYGWFFYHKASMDNAIHVACRAGAVVDPQRENPMDTAQVKLEERLAATGTPCVSCTMNFDLVGAYPNRSMSCQIQQSFTDIIGLVPTPSQVRARTLVRMEWQDDVNELYP
jgi:Flp pilus assembly protein TadG